MKSHQLKNFILLAIVMGIVGTIFIFGSLVASMAIYNGFDKTSAVMKKVGVIRSTGIFANF